MANKGDRAYNMSYKKTGLLLVMGVENFIDHEGKREGNQHDVDALDKTFKKLNFEVRSYPDLTSKEMREAIHKAVKGESFRDEPVFQCQIKDAGCFAIAIMTHGGENGRMCCSEGETTLRELAAPLRGRLFGKPKIFIIQACRGDQRDAGVSGKVDGNDVKETIYRLPLEADFLYAYSSVDDYASNRRLKTGSWFIQSLCECFDQYPKEEVLRILTRVNNKVAIEYQNSQEQKQMPSIVSQLTK